MSHRADSPLARHEPNASRRKNIAPLLSALLAVGLSALLLWALVELAQDPSAGLTVQVEQRLEQSGVGHAVTAVLLNFRGYDTWLELGVLLVAVMGALTLQRAGDVSHVPPLERGGEVLSALVHLLMPWMVLIGGYLLWLGSHAPGGAFQAGAVLAAAGVLMRLAGAGRPLLGLGGPALRVGMMLGVGVFAMVAVSVMLTGRALLELPVAWAGTLIFAIELAATFGIALALVLLFIAAHPVLSDANNTSSQGE